MAKFGIAVCLRDVGQCARVDVCLRHCVNARTLRFGGRTTTGRSRQTGWCTSDGPNLVICDLHVFNVDRTDVAHDEVVSDLLAHCQKGAASWDTKGVARVASRLFQLVAGCNCAKFFVWQRIAAPEVPKVVVRVIIKNLRNSLTGRQDVIEQSRVLRREPTRVECVVAETCPKTKTGGACKIGCFCLTARPAADVETVDQQVNVVLVETTWLGVTIKGGETDVGPCDLTTKVVRARSEATVEGDRIVDRKGIAAKLRWCPAVLKPAKRTIRIRELVIDVPVDTCQHNDNTARFRIFIRKLHACAGNGRGKGRGQGLGSGHS